MCPGEGQGRSTKVGFSCRTPTAPDASTAEPVSAVLLLQIKVDVCANVDAGDFSTLSELSMRQTLTTDDVASSRRARFLHA